MPDDMADVRAAFARLDEDDVLPGPVGESLADRLTERVTETPSVLEQAVAAPPGAAVPGPGAAPVAGVPVPPAGVPAPVVPPAGTPGSHTQPASGPAAGTPLPPAAPPPDTPDKPENSPGDPAAGTELPDSAAEPAWPESDSQADPDNSTVEPDGSVDGAEPDDAAAEPDDAVAGAEPDSPLPADPDAESGEPAPDDSVAGADPDDTSVEPEEPAPDDPAQEPVQSATTAAPVSKPDGWQVDSYELRAFTDAVMRARSYLDDVQAKVDRMQGAEMTPQLGTSPVGKQLAKKFDDRLNSADGLRAMLAEAMKRMEDFVTSAEKAARSYEELEENTVANLQSAKHG